MMVSTIFNCCGHTKFKDMGVEKIRSLCKPSHYIFDIKYLFSQKEVDGRL